MLFGIIFSNSFKGIHFNEFPLWGVIIKFLFKLLIDEWLVEIGLAILSGNCREDDEEGIIKIVEGGEEIT